MYKIYCECGYGIKGVSEAHAVTNLKEHRDSKLHHKLMEIKSLDNTTHNDNKHKGEQQEYVAEDDKADN